MVGNFQPGTALEGPVADLLADRYALIVGLVGADGHPYATRGWGLTVLPGPLAQFRLVLSSDDGPQVSTDREGHLLAVTAADPRTLRAVQFKGRTGPAEAATTDDRAAVVRFCQSFFGVVEEVEGTDRALLERLVPGDFVACTVVIESLYDQAPGPGAGAELPGPHP